MYNVNRTSPDGRIAPALFRRIAGPQRQTVYTRGVQKKRGQMLPFPQFVTEQRETFT